MGQYNDDKVYIIKNVYVNDELSLNDGIAEEKLDFLIKIIHSQRYDWVQLGNNIDKPNPHDTIFFFYNRKDAENWIKEYGSLSKHIDDVTI